MIRSGLLALVSLSLFIGTLRADTPAKIYILDFNITNGDIDFNQTNAVDMQLATIMATSLSSTMVNSLGNVAPTQRITDRSQAVAPGWIITGSINTLILSTGFITSGNLTMTTTVQVSDLSTPNAAPLCTFNTRQYYNPTLTEEDPWRDADGGTGGTLSGPSYMHGTTSLDNLSDAMAEVNRRSAKQAVYCLNNFIQDGDPNN